MKDTIKFNSNITFGQLKFLIKLERTTLKNFKIINRGGLRQWIK